MSANRRHRSTPSSSRRPCSTSFQHSPMLRNHDATFTHGRPSQVLLSSRACSCSRSYPALAPALSDGVRFSASRSSPRVAPFVLRGVLCVCSSLPSLVVRIAPNLNGKRFSVPQTIQSGFFNLDPIESARTCHTILHHSNRRASSLYFPLYALRNALKRSEIVADGLEFVPFPSDVI